MPEQKRCTEEDYLQEISRLWELLEDNQIPFYRDSAVAQNVLRYRRSLSDHPLGYLRGLNLQSPQIDLFQSLFHGRDDLFYRRSKSGAWYSPCRRSLDPACPKQKPDYVWKPGVSPCRDCRLREPLPMTRQDLLGHLCSKQPEDRLRIASMLDDGTVRFLVFDLDALKSPYAARLENALCLAASARSSGFDTVLERSATENGLHLWLFFETPVEAARAVEFGQMLILQAIWQEGAYDLNLFETLIPEGPARKKGSPGRSIELPLQPEQVRQGRTVFLDEQGHLCINPWKVLETVRKISLPQIDALIRQSRSSGLSRLLSPAAARLPESNPEDFAYAGSLFETRVSMQTLYGENLNRPLRLRLHAGIEIDAADLSQRLKAQLLLLGSCWNPEYAGRSARFASGPHVLSLSRLENGKLILPRGLQDDLEERLQTAGIPYNILDERKTGQRLEISCLATLRSEQEELLEGLEGKSCGILEAATGAGKTVMGAELIARRKTSTLVLVGSQEILQGWVRTLNDCLHYEEEAFESARLSSRKYPGKIGVLQASTNTLTGRVDIAMVPSLQSRDDLEEILDSYGMILFDECHHAASATAQKILGKAASRYVYGLSATPERSDGLSAVVNLQLGAVASRFTSKEQMTSQNFTREIIPRLTTFESPEESGDFMRIVQEASWDPIRNAMILDDVRQAIHQNRTILVLSRFVDHARFLARWIERDNPQAQVLVYAGDPREKRENGRRIKALDQKKPTVLVGTYSSIGEGFDYPPLDTLFLALPVRSAISISQAIGRIHRQTPSKTRVLVYDYVDANLTMLEAMYRTRLGEYRKQGYTLASASPADEPDRELTEKHGFSAGLERLDLDQAKVRCLDDLKKARSRIAIAARSFTGTELSLLLRMLDLAGSKISGHVRVDLFVEEMDDAMRSELADRNVFVHLHERIVERFVIVDQSIVWYGPLFGSDRAASLIRMKSKSFADDLLSLRRREELRLRKQAAS